MGLLLLQLRFGPLELFLEGRDLPYITRGLLGEHLRRPRVSPSAVDEEKRMEHTAPRVRVGDGIAAEGLVKVRWEQGGRVSGEKASFRAL